MICEARNPSQCTAPKCDCGKLPDSGSALAPDTAELVERLLDVTHNAFVVEVCYEAASALTALSATVEQLRKEKENLEGALDSAEESRVRQRTRAEAAERQLAELRASGIRALSLREEE